MGKFLDELSDDLQTWAQAQPIFFVASAPTRGKHVNVSPKGLAAATLTIFIARRAAYVDFPGSGSKTIAHVYDNGRVTLMFCSFEISPRTMRLFCWGSVIEADGGQRWLQAKREIEATGRNVADGARAIILLDIWKVGLSCGFGVPLLRNLVDGTTRRSSKSDDDEKPTDMATYCKDGFVDRPTMTNMNVKMTKAGRIDGFVAKCDTRSLDGMPGLRTARKSVGRWVLVEDARAWVQSRVLHPEALAVGFILGLLLAIIVSGLNGICTERRTIMMDSQLPGDLEIKGSVGSVEISSE